MIFNPREMARDPAAGGLVSQIANVVRTFDDRFASSERNVEGNDEVEFAKKKLGQTSLAKFPPLPDLI